MNRTLSRQSTSTSALGFAASLQSEEGVVHKTLLHSQSAPTVIRQRDEDGGTANLHMSTMQQHIRGLLETTNNKGAEYFTEEFEAHAQKLFRECDADKNGLLQGDELRNAVLKLLPSNTQHAVEATSSGGFTEQDRNMMELIQVFTMLTHDVQQHSKDGFGIDISQVAEFARFCISWRLYAYFNTPKLSVLDADKRPAVDVVFIGGPYGYRREQLESRLFISYHDVLDMPCSHTGRKAQPGEVNGLHHHFIQESEYLAMETNREFLVQQHATCGDYGYTFRSLTEPARSRNVLCLFPALIDSSDGIHLMQRMKRCGDIKVRTIYCSVPSDGGDQWPPDDTITGSLDDYYDNDKEAWEEEIMREQEEIDGQSIWDLILSGDLDENAAFTELEDFINDQLSDSKKKKKGKGKKKEIVEPIPPTEELYNQLATDPEKGFFRYVQIQEVERLYKNASARCGLDDAYIKTMSKGQCDNLCNSPRVHQVAEKVTDEKGRFGKDSLDEFFSTLSDEMHIDKTLLVGALEFSHTGALSITPDIMQAFFEAVPKAYAVGKEYSKNDWVIMCRQCNWLSPNKFTQGDADMVFQTVCRRVKSAAKPAKGKKKKGATDSKLGGGGEDVRKEKVTSIKRQCDFELLLELTAERQKRPPLKLIADIYATSRSAGKAYAQTISKK